jgi:two-component system LytT family response regulator
VLIVDDEPPARRRLRRLLANVPHVVVVGEAGDGGGAIAQARTLLPDVILLDVQMPGPSGLAVVAGLPHPRPHIIFVTAFDRYAVRAFELQALDYLLKPVSEARLLEAIRRVGHTQTDGAPGPEAPGATPTRGLTRIAVRSSGRIDMVPVSSIDWVEAANNYVLLHCGDTRHILRETLARLAERLDPAQFVRTHRSALVAVDRVQRLEPLSRGDWVAVLRDGAKVPVSRTYRAALFDRLASGTPASSLTVRG